ncbi:hypothetical protein [Herbaspirillum sp. VT-16-41]|uniref:hypothetical protein n=1 Tax=Herbaspirillum sp. VT-16-41 TaxID=1953765 RepID=UPI00143DC051|nr:hypothetical protein [Herbaspirillum sp. VT-16-41]
MLDFDESAGRNAGAFFIGAVRLQMRSSRAMPDEAIKKYNNCHFNLSLPSKK